MPSYAEAVSTDDAWQLAYYVRSLQRDIASTMIAHARRLEGPLPEDPDDPRWQEAPRADARLRAVVDTQGQINAPQTVTRLSVWVLHNGEAMGLRLMWNDTSDDRGTPADALAVIERSFTGAVWNALDTVKAAVGTVTDTTVRAGSSYQYRVRFVNLFGASDTSSSVEVTMPVLPQCSDTTDNDGDGKTDSQDPGCQNAEDDDETDPPAPQFRRGDANSDGIVDISDPIFILRYLFQSSEPPKCMDAADANDDGVVDISDSIKILLYLYTSNSDSEIPLPGAINSGYDPTLDDIGCETF